jgi:glutamyl-tRNA reductase
MDLFCIGINHRTAPLDVRERVWFSDEETARTLPLFRERNLRECVLVSTCNRTELYGIRSDRRTDDLIDLLIEAKQAGGTVRPANFYSLQSLLAVRHILGVASGIDSMVVGDVQILNQMKEAFEIARRSNTVGTLLSKLFPAALHTGKRSRTETEIGHGAVSVSYAAVELASKIFADLSRRKALLIGAGETGKLTAKHLVGKRIGQLYIANRTRERAEEIARQLGGMATEFGEIVRTMESVDVVITSVTAPSAILTAQDIQAIMRRRSNEPLFIIDIGVPRNVDAAAKRIDNVFLHDIDTLNVVVDRNLDKRHAEVAKVREIVHEEVLKFHQWHNSLQVTPTIQDLRDQFESIRQREVEQALHRFSTEQRESVEQLTKRIVNKILHTPMVNLKNGTDGEASEETLKKLSVLRHLFGLGHKNER